MSGGVSGGVQLDGEWGVVGAEVGWGGGSVKGGFLFSFINTRVVDVPYGS